MSQRRFKKRRYKKSGGFFKRAGNILATARSALKTARYVKNLLNVEYKHHEVVVDGGTLPAKGTGYIIPLGAMATGDTDILRDGNSIKAVGLSVKTILYSTGENTDLIRCIIFRDNDAQGEYPTGTMVLDTINVLSFRNLGNTARFTFLMDKIYRVGHIDAPERNGVRNINKFIKMNHKIKFIGSLGTEDSMGNGQIYLFLQGNASSDMTQYDIKTRIRYIDN